MIFCHWRIVEIRNVTFQKKTHVNRRLRFGGLTVFQRKSDNFLWSYQRDTFYRRKLTKHFFAKVSLFNKYAFRRNNSSTTTPTLHLTDMHVQPRFLESLWMDCSANECSQCYDWKLRRVCEPWERMAVKARQSSSAALVIIPQQWHLTTDQTIFRKAFWGWLISTGLLRFALLDMWSNTPLWRRPSHPHPSPKQHYRIYLYQRRNKKMGKTLHKYV